MGMRLCGGANEMTDREIAEKVRKRVFRLDRDFTFRVLVRYARLVERERIYTIIAKVRQLDFRCYP